MALWEVNGIEKNIHFQSALFLVLLYQTKGKRSRYNKYMVFIRGRFNENFQGSFTLKKLPF